jgi:hypothetical protein
MIMNLSGFIKAEEFPDWLSILLASQERLPMKLLILFTIMTRAL